MTQASNILFNPSGVYLFQRSNLNILIPMKTAVLCYIRNSGKTLMMHRNSRPEDMHFGKWTAPGGKIEPGETPEECAVREIFEETALLVENPRMRGILTFPAFEGQEDWYVYVFTAEEYTGILKKSCHEGDLFWVKDENLMDLSLWGGDRVFMKWLDSNEFFSAKLIYSSDGFVSYSVVFNGKAEEE